MSSWVVRRAEARDKEWVVEQAAAFQTYIDAGVPVDSRHLNQLFDEWVVNPACYILVAEFDDERRGVAIGAVAPHFLNPAVAVFTELMWWVPEEHRNGRAGLILLDALDKVGSSCAHLVSMSTEHNSPVNPKTLTKRGFVPQETTYLKKVEYGSV